MFRMLLLGFFVFAGAVAAQDRPRAILVLDASGSMWGQIDGKAKITIAQEVIGDLLQTLPAEQVLGLTVYGHRRKGDCSDIETLILPEGDQRTAIGAAVNAIKPKGKTPLSAAVIAAAEALRFSEEAATVILVSDGRETCEMDPCAVGRMLEETGVNFTAHVIGFDVSDPGDRAELQCLAEETGGTFRTASNAAELGDALAVVAEPPEPPAPKPFDVTFNAKDGAGGPTIITGLVWTVRDADGATLLQGGTDMTPTLSLLPGDYSAAVQRDVDGATDERGFSVDGYETVVLVLPELPPEPVRVRIFATDGKNGPRIGDDLIWDLGTGSGTALLDARSAPNLDVELGRDEYVVSVLRPIDEAYAELRFGVGEVPKTLVLELPEYRPGATLDAPDTAIAGETIQVRWTGPDAKNDFISVSAPGAAGSTWEGYTYTREGPLLNLRMPAVAGSYEIRYILSDGRKVLVSRPVEVTAVRASITAPPELPAGATVQVDWTGPDYQNDYIAVTESGEETYINYTYTREGSPLGLKLPGKPGTYDIIYTLNQDREIIARVPIVVTGLKYEVSAPKAAPAGSTVQVDWTGPDYQNDYISVAEIGSDGAKYVYYTYTREGSPLGLQMPLQEGRYEIRYVLSQDRQVEARTEIELIPVTATLKAPEAADVGSTIDISWFGPDYKNDYVSVVGVDEDELKYDRYTYTRDGTPLKLQMPSQPGDYVLRYIASGNPKRVLVSRSIILNDVTAILTAQPTATAGGKIEIEWQGPGNPRDYIAIGVPGKNYSVYKYASEGSPLTLNVPKDPGEYELRYILHSDQRVIATVPLKVE